MKNCRIKLMVILYQLNDFYMEIQYNGGFNAHY